MELLNHEQIQDELRKACEAAGSQKAWAKRHGVGTSYVCDVLMGRRGPGPSILDALGLELAGYRRVKPLPVFNGPSSEHSPACDWHADQYPWECTCGLTKAPEGKR